MAAFRFLQLLDLRRRERDRAAVDLAAIDDVLGQKEAALLEVREQRRALRDAQNQLRTGIIPAGKLESQSEFDRALRQTESSLAGELAELRTQVDRAHEHLVARQLEVATLEKLQRQQAARQRRENNRRQQLALDDIATARHAV